MTAPIFIVGCSHSGTSIMLSLLGNHPSICAIAGESKLFLEFDPPKWAQQITAWNMLTSAVGRKRWAEKTPRHLYFLKDIREQCPHAKIIAMLRDGRDVFSSHMERGTPHAEAIKLWKDSCRTIVEECPYVVRYERLIEDPETTLRDVCKYIGEEYSDNMLRLQGVRQHEWYTGSEHNERRNAQINQPLFDGRGRWKRDGYTLEQFDKGAKSLLLAMGYA